MRQNLPALTSLRFFAAAAIFALHAEQFSGFPKGEFAGFTLNHGVSFFYVLSGFILQYNYRDTKIRWASFLSLRFFRLWPLHLAGLALACMLAWSDIISWYHAYLTPISTTSIVFMMQAWDPDNRVYFAINGVSWSLSVEIFFYACFPLLGKAVQRSPAITTVTVSTIVAAFFVVTWHMQALHSFANGLYSVNPLVRLPEFLLGILIAELRERSAAPKEKSIAWTFYEVASLATLLLLNWSTHRVMRELAIYEPLAIYINSAWSAPACAIVIYVFSQQRGWISKRLIQKYLILLGEASFAIYIIHQPLQRFMAEKLNLLGPSMLTLSAAVATITGAIVLHRLVETPCYAVAKAIVGGKSMAKSASIDHA